MKFDDLCNLINESGFRPGAAKNRGLYSRTRESEKPSGYARGSAGFSNENPEKRTPDSRWEFDPSQVGDVGKLQGSKVWNTFKNAFGLLMNDGMFKPRLTSIIKKFNDERESINLEDEKKLDSLHSMKTKIAGEIAETETRLKSLMRQINDYNMPNHKKVELELAENKLSSHVNKLEEIVKREEKSSEVSIMLKRLKRLQDALNQEKNNPKAKDEKIGNIQADIDAIEKKLRAPKLAGIRRKMEEINSQRDKAFDLSQRLASTKMSKNKLTQIESFAFKAKSSLESLEERYKNVSDELEELQIKTSNVGTLNQQANDRATALLKKDVLYYANKILDDMVAGETKTVKSFDDVNWNDIGAGKMDQIAALTALTREDSSNPIFGYLERFQRAYNNKEFDIGKALNKNVNISTVRDFENLPFFTFSRIYKFLESEKAIQKQKMSEIDETSPLHQQGLDDIDNIIAGKEIARDATQSGDIRTHWVDEQTKEALRTAVSNLQIPEKQKMGLYSDIKQPFTVNRAGKTSFFIFKSRVDTAIRDAKKSIRNESFDVVAGSILQQFSFDEDDYKLDLMEVLEEKSKKCDGPTKKASSDRKDKKWTKCAKQPDGSYKRIHWGEKGVRIGKDNPKRKKSFSARHNCKNAKKGSANAQSCADWNA